MEALQDNELLFTINLHISEGNWNEVQKYLRPKQFGTLESGVLINIKILAKVAEVITNKNINVPTYIQCTLLKCIGNSCFNGYKYKKYDLRNIEQGSYCNALYAYLSDIDLNINTELENINPYPYTTHFPYDGVAEWCVDCIISKTQRNTLSDALELDLLRLCIQFLCNLFTFGCKDISPEYLKIPKCLNNADFKEAIINLIQHQHIPISRASGMFVHNILHKYTNTYFTKDQKNRLCMQLLEPLKEGIPSVCESMFFLINEQSMLRSMYEDMLIEDKLYLLEMIYQKVSELHQSKEKDIVLSKEVVEYLSERFRKRSDLILKTVDTYLADTEPMEIIILLDILGVLTSLAADEYKFLQSDKSLLINCTYLLKSLHMIGKESNNFFTPLQKLSDVAHVQKSKKSSSSNVTEDKVNDPQCHPAFGFKAGLIRVIGNMSYKNEPCQDLLRELNAIPLLLDSCNIDARNPLIMQWTILALRNLCEANPENQQIIRDCTKVGVVDNQTIREMGLTLRDEEDGKSIGIVPLIRDQGI